MQKTGKEEDAKKALNEQLAKKPGDPVATWVRDAFNGEFGSLPGEADTNENYRVLEEFIRLKL
jgi:hypothetical protein